MKPFSFVGKLDASKSILNRLLLVQSHFPNLQIQGDSQCEDVEFMRRAIAQMERGEEVQVGSAGTVLRFMALRVSRRPGRARLVGESRLFERPQQELIQVLRQLGVEAQLHTNALEIQSSGWKLHGDTLLVPRERSSQFVSSVLLNAWDLPFDLYVSQGGARVSEGYWRMSVELAQQMGMKIDFWDTDFRVPRGQSLKVNSMSTEIDLSSAFALAGVAAVNGQATFLDFPERSLQPDAIFLNILATMGVPMVRAQGHLKVSRAARLNGVAVNLKSAPDLFPVLAVLCALAEGSSEILGAPHLIHKESNRLNRIADLVKILGRQVEIRPDGLRVFGDRPSESLKSQSLRFDCDSDHRLAFAAAVVRAAGYKIEILNSEVVAKSFPHFWEIVGPV